METQINVNNEDDVLLIDGFLEEKKDQVSKSTISAYKHDLDLLERSLRNDNIALALASRKDIFCYLNFRLEEGKKSSTIARQLSNLREFYQYLLRKKAILKDPTNGILFPKKGKTDWSSMEWLVEEKINQLLKSPDLESPIGYRDRTMLEVLCGTGIRISELVALNVCDVDFEKEILHVTGKSGNERYIPLSPKVLFWVRYFLEEPRGEIILERVTNSLFPSNRGTHMTRQTFWYVIKKHAKNAGLSKKMSAQGLRHAYARSMREGGMRLWKLGELLGHGHYSTTKELYGHIKKTYQPGL